jgi:ABC-type transporter MlaC component
MRRVHVDGRMGPFCGALGKLGIARQAPELGRMMQSMPHRSSGRRALVISVLGVALAVAVVQVVANPPAPFAPAPEASALETVRSRYDEMAAVVRWHEQPSRSSRQGLGRIADDFLDLDAIAQHAAGAHWSSATDTQRRQFQLRLGRLIEGRLEEVIRMAGARAVHHRSTGVSEAGRPGTVTVISETVADESRRTQIVWLMHFVRGAWRVFAVEGTCIVPSRMLQDLYDRRIRAQGWEMFLLSLDGARISGCA